MSTKRTCSSLRGERDPKKGGNVHCSALEVTWFTQSPWMLIYIERWLKADGITKAGNITKREIGTPQGGVISPLLTNIYLHFVFDKWMERNYPNIHFERYADDIVVHCRSIKQLEMIKGKLIKRFSECKLALHPEKTKIVYCKDANRQEEWQSVSFDFLGYAFQPRLVRDKAKKFFLCIGNLKPLEMMINKSRMSRVR